MDMELLKTIPYKGIRKIIGEKMVASHQMPVTLQTVSVDMSQTLKLRAELNTQGTPKLSVNDFIIKAAVLAIEKTPLVNSELSEGQVLVYKPVNINVMAAIEGGLIAPVIRNAQNKTLAEISLEAKELFEKARTGKLMPEEYAGGTFSITNVGMMGTETFQPLIYPPQAAILGVCATKMTPAAILGNDGSYTMEIRPMMNIVLVADHRILDGVPMAQFLRDVKGALEEPGLLLQQL
ncbi:MAG: 2-oxo acid dehydrogenase subunit E2 [Christensenellales bacterium]